MNFRKNLKKITYLSAFLLAFFTLPAITNAVGLTVGTSTTILLSNENLYYGITSSSSSTGNFLLFEKGPGNTIFRIDHSGNITSTGNLIGANNYWNLSGSNLYASTTDWRLGIGTTGPTQKLDVRGVITASTGYRVNNALATSGTYLRGNGTNFVASSIQAADVPTLNQNTTGSAYYLNSRDTRLVDDEPDDFNALVKYDFKANSTNGLSDGGLYNGVMTWRHYGTAGDFSGGPAMQLAYTSNGNLWTRTSASSTAWNTWKKILNNDTGVLLQSSTPGTAQAGNINISGNGLFGGKIGVGATSVPNDIFSIANGGAHSPATSTNTGHNYTSTYFSSDKYALANYGLVETLVTNSSYWTRNGNNLYPTTITNNVGIGTITPGAILPNGWVSNVDAKLLHISSASVNYDAGLFLRRSDNATGIDLWSDNSIGDSFIDNRYNNDTGDIRFRTKTAGTPVDALTITGSGNVGIGTTNPDAKLNILGTVGSGSLSPQEDLLHIGGNELGGAGGYAGLKIGGTQVGTYSTYIRSIKTGAYGSVWNSDLAFSVTRAGTTNTIDEVMRLTSAGNVGIGTVSPQRRLDIYETATTTVANVLGVFNPVAGTSAQSNGASIIMGHSSGNYYNKIATVFESSNPSFLNPALVFYTMNNSYLPGSEVERMRISSNGRVGIGGTTTPNDILSLANGGVYAPAGSIKTGHNYTSTYLSTDKYALANYGLVETLVSNAVSPITLWGGSTSGDIWALNSGNVGIGTISPSRSLQVEGSISLGNSTGRAIYFHDGANKYGIGLRGSPSTNVQLFSATGFAFSTGPDTFGTSTSDKMVIANSGNVGIGTSSPASILHISKTSGDAILSITNSGNGNTSGIDFIRERSTGPNFNGGSIFMDSDTSGTLATLYIQSQSTSANAGITAALTAANGVRLMLRGGTGIFSIENGATESMRILANGRVGIGVTSPGSKLTIESTGGAANATYLTTAANAALNLQSESGLGTGTRLLSGIGNSEYVWLQSQNGNDNSAKYIVLNPVGGNVGIGTTNPTNAKLQVVGNIATNLGGKISPVATDIGAANIEYDVSISEARFKFNGYYGHRFDTQGGTRMIISQSGKVGVGAATIPNDIFSIANGGSHSPATSTNTGHNYTSTYFSSDKYALANYGLVETLVTNSSYWTRNGNNLYPTTIANNVGIGTATPRGKIDIGGYYTVNRISSSSSWTGAGSNSPLFIPLGSFSTDSNIKVTLNLGGCGYGDSGLEYMVNRGHNGVPRVYYMGPSSYGTAPRGLDSNVSFHYRNNNETSFYLGVDIAGGCDNSSRTITATMNVVGSANFESIDSNKTNYTAMSAYPYLYSGFEGNVGIGTSSPEVKLDVIGGNLRVGSAGAGQSLTVNGNSGTTATIFLNSASKSYGIYQVGTQDNYLQGDLGIGTTNPQAQFHVSSNNFPVARIERAAAAQTNIYASDWAVRTNPSGLMNGAGVARYFGLSDNAGNLQYAGSFGVKWVDSTAKTMLMTFNTANGGADPTGGTERMVIDGTGNVGIGTTSPASKLTVISSSPAAPYSGIGLYSNGATSYTAYTIGRTGVDGYFAVAGGANHYLTGSAASDVMINAVSGKVLIGTGSIPGTIGLAVTNGKVAVGGGAIPYDVFSIANTGGLHSLATSTNTGHNYTQTYFSSDKYALANYGLVETLINSSVPTIIASSSLWGAGSNNIWSLNTGNVGIGTASPESELHVKNSATTGYISYEGNIAIGRSGSQSTQALFGRFQNAGDTASGNSYYTYIGNNAKHVVGSNYLTYYKGNGYIIPSVISFGGDGKISFLTSQVAGENNHNVNVTLAERMVISQGGLVGIGVGSNLPNAKLQVKGGSSVAAPSTVTDSNLSVGTGDFGVYIRQMGAVNGISGITLANQIIGRDGNAFEIYSLGGQPLVLGTNSTERMRIDGSGRVGVGASSPTAKLTINQGGYNWPPISGTTPTGGFRIQAEGGGNVVLDMGVNGGTGAWIQTTNRSDLAAKYPLMLNPNGGNVGVGATSTPYDIFSIANGGYYAPSGVSNTGHNFTSTYISSDPYALVNYGILNTLLDDELGSYLPLAGGTMVASSSINMNNGTITALDTLSVRKINAVTIDPLYTINGTNYSTFAPSVAGGVKEEFVGKAEIKRKKGTEYEYKIDFNLEKEGTDLWVWRKTVDYSDDNVQVLVTPSGSFAKVYYVIEGNNLIFRSDRPVKVSYRLVGNRFDWREWPTKALDQIEQGLIVR